MGAEDRPALRERFIALVDAALAEEALPPELEALVAEAPAGPPAVDQYALWSALIAVSQEVKLQSREFRELTRAVQTLTTLPTAAVEPLPVPNAAHLELLIDTIERLERLRHAARAGRETLAAASRPWLARVLALAPDYPATPILTSLEDGLQLAAARLRDELSRQDVHEVKCLGLAFDPVTMSALGAVEDPNIPEGTVVEVLRSPWRQAERTVRAGQVKISRKDKV